MSNTINFDTEVLLSLVTSLKAAQDSIDEAVKLLQRVTTHDDWYCKARDQINETITQNMKKAQELQEMSTTFTVNVEEATEDFIAEENALIAASEELENMLAEFFHVSSEIIQRMTPKTTAPSIPNDWLIKKFGDLPISQPIGTPSTSWYPSQTWKCDENGVCIFTSPSPVDASTIYGGFSGGGGGGGGTSSWGKSDDSAKGGGGSVGGGSGGGSISSWGKPDDTAKGGGGKNSWGMPDDSAKGGGGFR